MSSSPLPPGLIDTSLLVGCRAGDPLAVPFALCYLALRPMAFSQLSAIAAVTQCPSLTELPALLKFIQDSEVHPVSVTICRQAYQLMTRLPVPAPLTADDAIVAATAVKLRLPLYTLNPGRFAAVPKLTTLKPY